MRELFLALGRDSKQQTIDRLRAGRDVDGQPLARKEGEGPPGVTDEESGGLFPLLRDAALTADEESFTLTYHPIVEKFNDGEGTREPRPILGISRRQRADYSRRVGKSLVSQAVRLGVSRG